MTHYLFCLRHFNDIDNITPAIHFLLERRPVRVTILIYSLDYDYRSDPSLQFLQRTWGERLRVVWIGALAGYSEAIISRPRFRTLYQGCRLVFIKPVLSWAIEKSDAHGDWTIWLRNLFDAWACPSIAIFDQNRTSTIAGLLAALRGAGVERIVSLPVSPWINFNVLRQVDFIKLDADEFRKKHDYSGFDEIGQVDSYYSDSLEGFFKLLGHPSPFQGRERVLGAIRYTDDWLSVRAKYVNDVGADSLLPSRNSGRHRLLVLPSHRKGNAFWDEYLRTLDFIAQFEDYDILVKPHTRYGDGYNNLPKNIRMMHDINTSQLIDWSEIILFWSSSVTLEGFQKGKTMINLDYLNGNHSLFTLLAASYLCRSRDDLMKVLLSEREMQKAKMVSANGRDLVLRNVIEGGQGSDVVDRYLEFCEGDNGASQT